MASSTLTLPAGRSTLPSLSGILSLLQEDDVRLQVRANRPEGPRAALADTAQRLPPTIAVSARPARCRAPHLTLRAPFSPPPLPPLPPGARASEDERVARLDVDRGRRHESPHPHGKASRGLVFTHFPGACDARSPAAITAVRPPLNRPPIVPPPNTARRVSRVQVLLSPRGLFAGARDPQSAEYPISIQFTKLRPGPLPTPAHRR